MMVDKTYSLTRFTLASTVFCATSPSAKVSLDVWKNCWCQAAGELSLIMIWLAKSWAMNWSRSCSFCRAAFPAPLSCCGVKGGMTTGGGGGGLRTPFTGWLSLRGAAQNIKKKNCELVIWNFLRIKVVGFGMQYK